MSSRLNDTDSIPPAPPSGSSSGTPNSALFDTGASSPSPFLRSEIQAPAGKTSGFRFPHTNTTNGIGFSKGQSHTEPKGLPYSSCQTFIKSVVDTVRARQRFDESQAMIEKNLSEQEKWRDFRGASYEAMNVSHEKHLKKVEETKEKHREKNTVLEDSLAHLMQGTIQNLFSMTQPDLRDGSEIDQLKEEIGSLKADIKSLKSGTTQDNVRITAIGDILRKRKDDIEQLRCDVDQAKGLRTSIGRLEDQIMDLRKQNSDALTSSSPELSQLVEGYVEKKIGNGTPLAHDADMVKEQIQVLLQSGKTQTEELDVLKRNVRDFEADVKSELLGNGDLLLQRIAEAEKTVQDTKAALTVHEKDWVDHKARLMDFEGREESRRQQYFTNSPVLETLQIQVEALKVDQAGHSKSLSNLASQFQSYALSHTTTVGEMQDSLHQIQTKIQQDVERLREEIKLIKEEHQKSVTSPSAQESAGIKQSNLLEQCVPKQGWQTTHFVADGSSELAFLRQKTQSLEIFVHSHEQRLNNTTLEPFLRSIINQMKSMYPYPDAVVRELQTIRAHYGQLNQVIDHEIPSLRARLGQLETIARKANHNTMILTDNDIPTLKAGLTNLESLFFEQQKQSAITQNAATEQREVDHVVQDSSDQLVDLEKRFCELQRESITKFEDFTKQISRESSIRTQYQTDFNTVLEHAKDQYDRQIQENKTAIKKLEAGHEDLQNNLVQEVGDYHNKVVATEIAIENLRAEMESVKSNPPSALLSNSDSTDPNGYSVDARTAPRFSNSATRTHVSSGNKSSMPDRRHDTPDLGSSILGRRKKRRRVVNNSDDDDDDSNYHP